MRNRYLACRQIVAEVLAAARQTAGMSQRQLSAKLKRSPHFVYLVEKGERKLEFCELIEYARLIRADPLEIVKRIMDRSKQQKR